MSVDVPVCRHNVGELPLIAAAAAGLGASAVTFSVTGLSERPEHAALLDAALETATVNRLAAHARGWAHVVPAAYAVGPVAAR